jgi:hypothetical protein
MTSFILFALVALADSFIDTLVFRSGKSIFPASWSPFTTYSTTSLFLGLWRLDPFHIAKFVLIFSAIGSILTYHPVLGVFDFFIYLAIWGVFFEGSWRLFYKP